MSYALYSSTQCSPCVQLKEYAKSKGIEFSTDSQEYKLFILQEDAQPFAENMIRSVPTLMKDGETVMVGFDKSKFDEVVG